MTGEQWKRLWEFLTRVLFPHGEPRAPKEIEFPPPQQKNGDKDDQRAA